MATNNLPNVTTPETARRLANRVLREEFENERHQLQLIDERDAAEEAFIEAFFLIVGRPLEFSSAYGYREALDDMQESLLPHLVILNQKKAQD